MDPIKREFRQQKREIKRAGSKRRRLRAKQALAEDPEDARYTDGGFGRYESAAMNGIDRDATRRRKIKSETE
jgi:hypothetical protein